LVQLQDWEDNKLDSDVIIECNITGMQEVRQLFALITAHGCAHCTQHITIILHQVRITVV